MGPLGWLLFIWFVLPVMAVWYLLLLLVRLCVLACGAIAAHAGEKERLRVEREARG